ncbi:MAG: hypothetical protein WC986_13675 [Elusimicrobiota bacterium]|jgi:hypothetical protein
MQVFMLSDGSYYVPEIGASFPPIARGKGGHLDTILADPTTVVVPYVPPPPPTPAERRAEKYADRVDKWSLSIVRYQARLGDPDLSAAQKAKIQVKLDASIAKVRSLSTQIENEDPD